MGHVLRDGADWIEVVSEAYAAPSLARWADTVIEGLGRILEGDGFGVTRVTYDEHGGLTFDLPGERSHPVLVEGVRKTAPAIARPEVMRSVLFPPAMVETHSEVRARVGAEHRQAYEEFAARALLVDSVGLLLHPLPGLVAVAQSMSREKLRLDGHERRRLSWLGLHLEASLRLLLRPKSLRAVLGPGGRLEHATPGAPEQGALAAGCALVDASHARHREAGEALRVWRALTAGRLSAVPRTVGTRRHYYFFDNPPHLHALASLTAAEQHAVGAVCRLRSSKLAAYELGISETAVSLRLRSASAKLGQASNRELLQLAGLLTRDPRALLDRAPLSPTEEQILALLAQGLSNQQIARMRSRSVRTIANQVASLLRKTGQPNRVALALQAFERASREGREPHDARPPVGGAGSMGSPSA